MKPHDLKSKLVKSLPAPLYAQLIYYRYHKRFINLKNPRLWTEMIQWTMLYGNLERFSKYADKYEVRDYVAEKVGAKHLIPLLGVYDSFDDIDFDALPDQFVLKATHGCAYNYICRDKSSINRAELKATFDRWLSVNYYDVLHEPQYKNIKPRIVAEKFMQDETGQLRDYKFYCWKGEVKLAQQDIDRFTKHKSLLYDTNWNFIETVQCATFDMEPEDYQPPRKLKEMMEIASKLSADFPMVRVDLYCANDGQIYFGEFTFTPGSGIVTFEPADTGDLEFARILGMNIQEYQTTQ